MVSWFFAKDLKKIRCSIIGPQLYLQFWTLKRQLISTVLESEFLAKNDDYQKSTKSFEKPFLVFTKKLEKLLKPGLTCF